MKTKFPEITHISQLDFLRDEPEFIFKQEGNFTIVFYAVAFPHTFGDLDEFGHQTEEAMIRRECRGITFDKDGNIYSRPYHKFFNLNEREETQKNVVDFNQKHIFLDKLDGSMIRFVEMDGNIVPFTKAGYSEVAKECEELAVTENIRSFVKDCLRDGLTPIFEYIGSPKYPIVLQYEQPELILTAIRETKSGSYHKHKSLEETGRVYNIPVVPNLNVRDIETAQELAEEIKDTEGWVVRFDSGYMIKVKTSFYLRNHNNKEKINKPRHLTNLILNNDIDDILPELSDVDRKFVKNKMEVLKSNIDKLVKEATLDFLDCNKNYTETDRASFAKRAKTKKNPDVMFSLFNGSDIEEVIIKRILRYTTSDTKFEQEYGWLYE